MKLVNTERRKMKNRVAYFTHNTKVDVGILFIGINQVLSKYVNKL